MNNLYLSLLLIITYKFEKFSLFLLFNKCEGERFFYLRKMTKKGAHRIMISLPLELDIARIPNTSPDMFHTREINMLIPTILGMAFFL